VEVMLTEPRFPSSETVTACENNGGQNTKSRN